MDAEEGPLERGRVARLGAGADVVAEAEVELRVTAMLECGRAITRGTTPFGTEVGVAGSRPAH